MNRKFSAGDGFKVPDGTMVYPIFDPSVISPTGKWKDDLSLAKGIIPAGVTSKIHLHPIVTQITWVLSGRLTVKMGELRFGSPYTLNLSVNESAVTEPGTFFQLISGGREDCEVLYIVGPAFIFECNEKGEVIYNDAIVLDEGWSDLEKKGWLIPQMADVKPIEAVRTKARARMMARRSK